ncbi:hypothetical protein NQ117_10510 [Paenibacillus sp. SC116]|nr:hypothetical protein [Paenibacillus sp. SC116]
MQLLRMLKSRLGLQAEQLNRTSIINKGAAFVIETLGVPLLLIYVVVIIM